MKYNLKKMLQKCLKQDKNYVLLHDGFTDNCNLTKTEKEQLLKLAEELYLKNLVIVFDNTAFTPYITSYNGGQVLAGIKFNNIEEW